MTARKHKPKLAIDAIEYIQSTIDGGHPVDNFNANLHDMGSGTPLLVVSKRSLVDFLRKLDTTLGTCETNIGRLTVRGDVKAMLEEYDTFVF